MMNEVKLCEHEEEQILHPDLDDVDIPVWACKKCGEYLGTGW